MSLLRKIPFWAWLSIIILAAYAILFQVMAHTHLVQKIMACATFNPFDLLLVVFFLALRIITYLLLPPLILSALAHTLLTRLLRR